jgi:hypothetical protein
MANVFFGMISRDRKEFFHFLQSMLPKGLGNVCFFGFFSAGPGKPKDPAVGVAKDSLA